MTKSKLEIIILLILATSCRNNTHEYPVFYVNSLIKDTELDSLIKNRSSGKLVYYTEKNEFKIIPANYKTNDYEGMRYMKIIGDTASFGKEKRIKYDVTVSDSLFVNETYYNLIKYIFRNGKWEVISDMQHIPAKTNRAKALRGKFFDKKELADIIVETIALDSFVE